MGVGEPQTRTLAMELPVDLVDKIDAQAKARVVGRKALLPHLLELGLLHLAPWPPEPPLFVTLEQTAPTEEGPVMTDAEREDVA